MIKLVQVSKFLFKLSKFFVLFLFLFFVLGFFYEKTPPCPGPLTFNCNDMMNLYSYSYAVLDVLGEIIFIFATLLFVVSLLKYIIFKISKKEDPQKQSEIKKSIFYAVKAGCLALLSCYAFQVAYHSFHPYFTT